jgi:hypothetical protein
MEFKYIIRNTNKDSNCISYNEFIRLRSIRPDEKGLQRNESLVLNKRYQH